MFITDEVRHLLGVRHGVPMSEYQDSPGLSRGRLLDIARSPAHMQWKLKNPDDATPAMRFGEAFHTIILEPDRFEREYTVGPALPKNTKEGKIAWGEFYAKNPDKTVLTADDMVNLRGMVEAVLSRPRTRALRDLSAGNVEVSFYWDLQGVLCKGRADILRHDGMVVDLKKCIDASPEAFQRTITTYNYHVQGAYYLDGLRAAGAKAKRFVLLAVESDPPYGSAMYALDEATIEKGREQYLRYFEIYRRCLETGVWPGYEDSVQEMNLCPWGWTK